MRYPTFGAVRLWHGVRRTPTVVVLLSAAIVLPGLASSQTGVLTGRVSTDTMGRFQLVGAEVAIPKLNRLTRANSSGDYRFDSLPPGRHLVTVRSPGYKPIGDSVTVAPTGETWRDFVLSTKVVTLDSVVSTAKAKAGETFIAPGLQGFEERRRLGIGSFIANAELRKHDDGDRLESLLKLRASGIRIVIVRDGSYAVAGRSVKGGRTVLSASTRLDTTDGPFPPLCYATVYLDGVKLFDYGQRSSRTPPPNLDDFQINQLAGVEYYAGEATLPPQFSSTAGCGALLLWTRE